MNVIKTLAICGIALGILNLFILAILGYFALCRHCSKKFLKEIDVSKLAANIQKANSKITQKEEIPMAVKGKINKTDKILCIVESPNKKATISSIFKSAGFSNVTVMASVGHITEIKDDKESYWNTGIYPDKDFKINFTVSAAKRKVVEELKNAVKKADVIILATDPDREGECISWHLKEQLKIPASKYQRITFHEITKPAILAALEEPRKIDEDLVNAAKARSVIDKIIGYRLSPIARSAVESKSVGRCQSAGLKIIVDRELEIRNFIPEKYYDLYLYFVKNKNHFKAKYAGFAGKSIKKFDKIEDCNKVISDCEGHDFTISSVEQKDLKEYPKAPFTTSTFQQEANKVCGMSIDAAMSCAQKLFEGINIMGEHIGLITYIRTDDDTMSPEFAKTLKTYITAKYSDKYLGTVKSGPKSETAQAGHECLRVVDPEMTPEKLRDYVTDRNLLKIYRLIWNRTVSSMMAPAIIGDTQYNIENQKHSFVMHSKEMKFDGYRAIYNDTSDDADDVATEDDVVKETFEKGEILKGTNLKVEEKMTAPPKRYTQATFVKEMEKQGIGRPSTFAAIIKTLLAEDRGYCITENKFIVPTEKGISLSKFLDEHFDNVISIKYTSEMEKGLDLIAKGELESLSFLNSFYNNLEDSIKEAKVEPASTGVKCPVCGAPMKLRKGPYGAFWGCSKYPTCKGVRKIRS